MTRTSRIAGTVTALAFALCGCTPAQDMDMPTQQLDVGTDLTLTVWQARTASEQRTGLAGRDALPAGTGMLFPFDPAAPQRVWMAGMRFPIDIAWIRDGQIIATDTLPVCTAENTDDCPRWDSPGDVDALLETGAGTLNNITPGTTITTTRE